jgi:hypothetical protein
VTETVCMSGLIETLHMKLILTLVDLNVVSHNYSRTGDECLVYLWNGTDHNLIHIFNGIHYVLTTEKLRIIYEKILLIDLRKAISIINTINSKRVYKIRSSTIGCSVITIRL